jgi:hypothetical protein
VNLHPRSRTFVGFQWEGSYYIYNGLPFGLTTSPWVFSKGMRELVMHCRKVGIRLLPYPDDFLFMAKGFWQCARLTKKVKADLVRAGLKINVPKCHTLPMQLWRQLGFDVDFADGKFVSRSTDGRRRIVGGRACACLPRESTRTPEDQIRGRYPPLTEGISIRMASTPSNIK